MGARTRSLENMLGLVLAQASKREACEPNLGSLTHRETDPSQLWRYVFSMTASSTDGAYLLCLHGTVGVFVTERAPVDIRDHAHTVHCNKPEKFSGHTHTHVHTTRAWPHAHSKCLFPRTLCAPMGGVGWVCGWPGHSFASSSSPSLAEAKLHNAKFPGLREQDV